MTQLNDEQQLLRQVVRELAETRIKPRAPEIDATGEFPWDIVQLLREHDLVGVGVPQEYGGMGADFLTTALIIEEVARIDATSSLIVAVQELGLLPIILAGNDEQKRRYLPKGASGEWLAAFGLSEPEAGSDAGATRTRAVKRGDRYILNGTKHFVTNAGTAKVYVVFASTDRSQGVRGISAFIVEDGMPGFSIGKLEHKMGIRGSQTGELIFQDAEIPAENLLGGEGDGFKVAMMTLDRTRTGIGAQALGIAQGALDVAVAYAKERRQFGRPIAEFQGLQFMLADMATQVEAARHLLYHACQTLDGYPRSMQRLPAHVAKLSAMAKYYAADTAMKVTTDAVQILGGYGYMKEYPVERMMRDAKITQIYEGTNQIQRLVVARALIDGA